MEKFANTPPMPVEIARRDAGKKFPSRKLKRIALQVLDLVGQGHAELSIALIGNAEMRELNANSQQGLCHRRLVLWRRRGVARRRETPGGRRYLSG